MSKRKPLIQQDPGELIALIIELQQKLKRKHADLSVARQKLSRARTRIQKMKGIVLYQRNRILKLYND